jgi:hypothetical protein
MQITVHRAPVSTKTRTPATPFTEDLEAEEILSQNSADEDSVLFTNQFLDIPTLRFHQ